MPEIPVPLQREAIEDSLGDSQEPIEVCGLWARFKQWNIRPGSQIVLTFTSMLVVRPCMKTHTHTHTLSGCLQTNRDLSTEARVNKTFTHVTHSTQHTTLGSEF